ncbi:hypothetical protein RHAL1_00964 [Beijerinckiaceae bacterium RH AL1]|nr:hypothetical protein [Beijerinckiaceae bacterium]VVB43903.1 hypothetical protein RHCH11_RHCH11_00940 [Beijerinckiaceae bacterium RH CH11]VVB43930.1 hypothetical protein RHAL8_00937 [Beijerinckiaceae bacterium RH AL8]VVC54071.1 hypothetical protein RHAL1_00964 [Beijerinckiaceae bacterium RH AL1]
MNSTSPSRGIAIVANDKVMHWLLAFLESWKATNASLPVHLVPYDDNVAQTRRVAEAYGVTFADVDCEALDKLSRRLYPLAWAKRNRLRKLLSLVLPFDEVIYFDVDILLFRDLTSALGHLEPGVTDFIIVAETFDYVYNESAKQIDYLRGAKLFNDGFFITSRNILSVDDFYEAMAADEATFDKVRQRGGLYAQPLVNFVVHRKRLKIRTLPEFIPDLSTESYHKAQGIDFRSDGPYDDWGRPITFIHWPGVSRPSNLAFDRVWHEHERAGLARMAAAGIDLR